MVGQLVLAPIPVEANRDAVCQDQRAQQTLLQAPIPLQVHRYADCQDQLVQQSLLNAPVQQQGDRHANGHVNVKRKVQCKTVKLYKTSKNFTNVKVVKVASLAYFEELLIRNRAMCLIKFF